MHDNNFDEPQIRRKCGPDTQLYLLVFQNGFRWHVGSWVWDKITYYRHLWTTSKAAWFPQNHQCTFITISASQIVFFQEDFEDASPRGGKERPKQQAGEEGCE